MVVSRRTSLTWSRRWASSGLMWADVRVHRSRGFGVLYATWPEGEVASMFIRAKRHQDSRAAPDPTHATNI